MRTTAEIEAEIKWLKENKPRIAERNFFGESNHDAIDAQIKVLEERADEEAVFDWQDIEEWTDRTTENARDAAQWLDGDDEFKPSAKDNWGGLVK